MSAMFRSATVTVVALAAWLANASNSSAQVPTIQLGQTVNGALHQGSSKLPAGRPELRPHHRFAIYQLDTIGMGENSFTIDLVSQRGNQWFDPYVILLNAQGQKIDEDDDRGGDFNARIANKILQPGLYYIIVTTYNRDAMGSYRLSVSQGQFPNQ
jgi:hypothetical protein